MELGLTTCSPSQIDDCTKEWTFPQASLDYVHIRFLTGCIADWEALIKVAYRCLKPGGYIESMEPSAYIQSDDNTIEPDSAMGQWGKIFVRGQIAFYEMVPSTRLDRIRYGGCRA